MNVGYKSPEAQEVYIAHAHGKPLHGEPVDFMRRGEKGRTTVVIEGAKGTLLGGLTGLGVGHGATRILGRYGHVSRDLSAIGGLVGAAAGEVYGIHRGVRKHGERLNALYSEKQAAMNELLESGVSFDEAVEMIKEASASE